MTNDEQRKAFEAWLCPYDDDAMKRMTLEKRGDGNYAQALPRLQWKVWQAATAAERERCAKALEVDASEWEDHADNHADDDEDKQMSLARVDSLRELAAAFREGTQ